MPPGPPVSLDVGLPDEGDPESDGVGDPLDDGDPDSEDDGDPLLDDEEPVDDDGVSVEVEVEVEVPPPEGDGGGCGCCCRFTHEANSRKIAKANRNPTSHHHQGNRE